MKALNIQSRILSHSRNISAWVLLAALAPALTGCFGAAVFGAGAGVLMIADRRPAETYLTDEGIEVRANNRISEKFGSNVHVNVTSYNRSLLLTGEVPDESIRAEVVKIASGTPNVKAISNEVQVAGVSSLGARSNDAYITSKVKARFIDANKFASNHVKVITESGSVYLLGLVTRQESEAAVELARTTAGVLKVVRVFEVISDEQARQMDNQAPAPVVAPAEHKKP